MRRLDDTIDSFGKILTLLPLSCNDLIKRWSSKAMGISRPEESGTGKNPFDWSRCDWVSSSQEPGLAG